jgi:hypothetical protein
MVLLISAAALAAAVTGVVLWKRFIEARTGIYREMRTNFLR